MRSSSDRARAEIEEAKADNPWKKKAREEAQAKEDKR